MCNKLGLLDALSKEKAQCGQRVALTLAVLAAFLFQASRAVAAEDQLSFEITSQPLSAALEQYGAATGRNVLYNSNLAIGRHSNSVKGTLSADKALAVMLDGTGLSAHRIAGDAVMLSAAQSTRVEPLPLDVAEYFRRIQIGLRTALCNNSDARPGSYRIAMRFRVDGVGAVSNYEQFGSAGDARVDHAVHDTVSRLRIGAPPPAGLRQPIVIVILPQVPGLTMGCNAAGVPTQATR